MKSWSDSRSPWGLQLRFDPPEFETMMDEFRARAGRDCFSPGRGIDVDRVLLKAIGCEADYVDLPDGVLGRSIFAPDGTARIEVARSLVDAAEHDQIARRRLRTTLAHECGHVACHSTLFIRDTATISLFPSLEPTESSDERPPMLCRSEAVGNTRYTGEWWEYQANQCMAALLLPKAMFAASVRARLEQARFASGEECIAGGNGETLVRALADEYDVSQTATFIRLQTLGFVPADLGGQLRFGD